MVRVRAEEQETEKDGLLWALGYYSKEQQELRAASALYTTVQYQSMQEEFYDRTWRTPILHYSCLWQIIRSGNIYILIMVMVFFKVLGFEEMSLYHWFLVSTVHVWMTVVRLRQEKFGRARRIQMHFADQYWMDVEDKLILLGVRKLIHPSIIITITHALLSAHRTCWLLLLLNFSLCVCLCGRVCLQVNYMVMGKTWKTLPNVYAAITDQLDKVSVRMME